MISNSNSNRSRRKFIAGLPRARSAWDRAPYSWNMVNLFSFGCHVTERAFVRTYVRTYASTDCTGKVGETIKRKGGVSQACLGSSFIQSFESTCDFFNCPFPLDVQNEIQLLSEVFCYPWLVCFYRSFFSPQIERTRCKEFLVIIQAVKEALSDFLASSSSLKKANTGKPA